jgi:hypothetical protein
MKLTTTGSNEYVPSLFFDKCTSTGCAPRKMQSMHTSAILNFREEKRAASLPRGWWYASATWVGVGVRACKWWARAPRAWAMQDRMHRVSQQLHDQRMRHATACSARAHACMHACALVPVQVGILGVRSPCDRHAHGDRHAPCINAWMGPSTTMHEREQLAACVGATHDGMRASPLRPRPPTPASRPLLD